AQEKQQKNYILHLWTSATPREMELYHLENMLSKKINKGTLFLCFTHWFTKYKAITKIRCVYHTNLSLCQLFAARRAYNKTFNVRLLATYFSAWQQLTGSSMTDAVVTFSERIGLIDNRKSSTLVPAFNDLELTESGEEINFMSLTSITSDFSDSFSGSIYSENGSEMDRRKLLTVAIEAAKEDRLAKCFKLKETVTKALTRLMHWPLCVAFEQWKEFSVRRSQLKAALTLLKSVHVRTITVMAFNCWKKSFDQAVKANSLWKLRVQEKYFRSLRVYKNYRKYIKHLSKRAYHHKMLKSFQKYFPVWQKKVSQSSTFESNLSLKRQSFNLWKENVLHQKSWMQQSLLHFMERQSNACLVHYFLLWRKHLHSSLIAK
uniref:Sfi1 spindle body domain-containing protein n=1 Tax=Biomphalaria glabrata TaxID=6526 RepID=A0A2C9LJZ6_BIOGL